MLNQTSLLKLLKRTRIKNWIYDIAMEVSYKGYKLIDLLELTLHEDAQTAFHAAWLLDTIVAFDSTVYAEDIPQIINYARQTTNPSCKRHYARIFMYCTTNKAITSSLNESEIEHIIELCFDWLINPKVKVAVKACASETLFNVSHCHPWIAEELRHQLQLLMQNGSPAIQATGRRLLNKL